MYIEKLHIDTFGKLSGVDIELDSGMNIIKGANESGKSTLAAFIKFIFYGVASKERERAMSWRTGGAAGSITVNDGGKRYRIERAVVGTREAVQLIDGDSNMPIRHALDGTTPGEMFFGVDAEMFAATAFVSQIGGAAPGGEKVSEGIENILFSADESVNTQRAMAKLDAARAALLHKNEKGGRLYELDGECAELELRLSEALRYHGEIIAKEGQLTDVRAKLEAAREKSAALQEDVDRTESGMLLQLFERRRVIEARMAELRNKIDTENAGDMSAIESIEKLRSKEQHLREELDKAAARVDEKLVLADDPVIDNYLAKGGRAALEAAHRRCRTVSKVMVAVGIIMMLCGLALAAVGVLPMMSEGVPDLIKVVGGGSLAAVAVIMFIVGAVSRKRADDIELDYDFDGLEAAIESRRQAEEADRFAELALETAKERYGEVCENIRRLYGCEPDGLAEKIDEINKRLRASDTVKAEYDKHASLLMQINAQLKPYSEAELREKLGGGADISEVGSENLSMMRREAEFARKQAESLEKRQIELEKSLAGLYPVAVDPAALSDRLSMLKAERSELEKRHAAYKLAYDKLAEASDDLRGSVAPRLASDAAQLMSHITEGKYRGLGVGSDLAMTADTEAGQKPLSALSSGTQDAAYLCLRLALISLLYRKTLPPVIFDESFVRQDDARLSGFLRLIRMQDQQSLIFTSNSREASIANCLGGCNLVEI